MALDTSYAQRAAQAQLLCGDPFVLPVFLAVALRNAAKPQDLWAAISALRGQARRYRERRADLDRALEDGHLDVTAATLKAVRTEAAKLTSLLGDAGGAFARSAFSSEAANPVTVVSLQPLGLIEIGLTALIAGAQKLLPEAVTRRLAWRLCRPQFRFLSDIASRGGPITELRRPPSRSCGACQNKRQTFSATVTRVSADFRTRPARSPRCSPTRMERASQPDAWHVPGLRLRYRVARATEICSLRVTQSPVR